MFANPDEMTASKPTPWPALTASFPSASLSEETPHHALGLVDMAGFKAKLAGFFGRRAARDEAGGRARQDVLVATLDFDPEGDLAAALGPDLMEYTLATSALLLQEAVNGTCLKQCGAFTFEAALARTGESRFMVALLGPSKGLSNCFDAILARILDPFGDGSRSVTPRLASGAVRGSKLQFNLCPDALISASEAALSKARADTHTPVRFEAATGVDGASAAMPSARADTRGASPATRRHCEMTIDFNPASLLSDALSSEERSCI